MEWVEGFGDSVEEAKEIALEGLGVHEDDAEIEVLSEAKLGLFNRVKEKARVRARVRPATPRSKDDRRRRRGKSGNGGGQSSGAKQSSRPKKRSGEGKVGVSPQGNGGEGRGQKRTGSAGGPDRQKPSTNEKKQNRKQDGGREAARNRK